MQVKAHARYIRMAPRKVRLVTNLVKRLPVNVAIAQLKVLPKAAARPVRKVIESAVANAIHNNKLDQSKLFIYSITADGGPVLKRWRPRAFGRAATIRKRSTHISVIISDEPVETVKKMIKPGEKAVESIKDKKGKSEKPQVKKAVKEKTAK